MAERGTIQGFSGSWGSGLGYLIVSGSFVPCENAQTVRMLAEAFGEDVITDNHEVDNVNGGHVGQEIVYDTEFGTLAWFAKADEWGTEVEVEAEAEYAYA